MNYEKFLTLHSGKYDMYPTIVCLWRISFPVLCTGSHHPYISVEVRDIPVTVNTGSPVQFTQL